jgi:hypothetical protein
MPKFILAVAVLLLFKTIAAQTQKTEVLLLGTFHFDNPGLDVAKFENANILSPVRQKEVQAVVDRLVAFKPDKIFIESEPRYQQRWDSILQQYKLGGYTLRANETHQLALKAAKALGHNRVYCADYRDAVFPFDSLMKVLAASKQTDMMQYIQKAIQQIEQRFNENLKKHTIAELLVIQNDPADEKLNLGFYLSLIKAGNLDNHIGAYLAGEWWRRNMVIYGNILKQLDGSEKKVIVLFGSSHTALLRELMQYNDKFNFASVEALLK